MPTQIDSAKRGLITDEMKIVAKDEGVTAKFVQNGVAKGTIVILRNVRHTIRPVGIGRKLKTKVNVNIGTSPDICNINLELRKLKAAIKYGTDTIMDLSIAGDLDAIRRKLLNKTPVPFGTVPIYQAAIEAEKKKGSIVNMDEDDIFGTIEKHAHDGVDFMTIHCGVTKRIVDRIAKEPRLMGIVSRGGSFLATWILENEKENPLYQRFDYLLEIAKEYDVVLSLGDGLRPGCIFDASDYAQMEELRTIGKLVEKARKVNVQVMVEGPGHLPLDQVRTNVRIAKSICNGAPFYVLGPIVTDVAAGYDHIVAAIGGSIAAFAGADFLCVVTPSEHLAFPLVEDVKQGLIATRIAAHVADIVKLRKKALEWDFKINLARARLDWDRQFDKMIDPDLAKKIYSRKKPKTPKTCTLCGKYCAIRLSRVATLPKHFPSES